MDVFGAPLSEVTDTKKVWAKMSEHVQRSKQNEALKSTITTSAVFFESGQSGHQSQSNQYSHLSDHFHGAIYNSSCDRQVPKSYSLSRITGKHYQRNLTAIDSVKSISNEFLNRTNGFYDDPRPQYNNNNGLENANGGPDGVGCSAPPEVTANATPNYGINKLDKEDLLLISDYLIKSFKNQHHPLGILNAKISFCFYTSYGCWKVKPIAILSTQAMREWEDISKRIYDIVRRLFPLLPYEYGNFDE